MIAKVKRNKPFWFKHSKWMCGTLLVSTLLFVYFVPHTIMYPKYQIIGWLIFIVIFGVLPVLFFITSVTFTKHVKLSLTVAALSPLIVGPTFGYFQEYREKEELRENGVWTNALVIDRKVILGRRASSNHWAIKCSFNANGHNYETAYSDDLSNMYTLDDTLKIIYSRKFPKIHSLDYEWQR